MENLQLKDNRDIQRTLSKKQVIYRKRSHRNNFSILLSLNQKPHPSIQIHTEISIINPVFFFY